MLKGLFQVLLNGQVVTYTNYDDIPEKIDNVIRFEPEIPEGPHTHEEHEMIDSLNYFLLDLMKRETGNRHSDN